MERIIYIDTEVGIQDRKIHDIGAVTPEGRVFHSNNINDFLNFLSGAEYLCGHNIVHHDLKYLAPSLDGKIRYIPVDTLYVSPLLFPKKPYHALLKDDKIQVDELNNPVNDSLKAKELLDDEVMAFRKLSDDLKYIFSQLLGDVPEFSGFFSYVGYGTGAPKGLLGRLRHSLGVTGELSSRIRSCFSGKICEHADIDMMIHRYPVELAYALSLVNVEDRSSIVPAWTIRNFPAIYHLIDLLCNTPCEKGCDYCNHKMDIHLSLARYFGFDDFRRYKGVPLQEQAVQAAIDGKSMLVVFPTGGGKSITFQLPALMAGDNAHGLTVVISPLQSLMKDQVDNLSEKGITSAVTVNGLLSPVERADAYHRIADGSVSILYISPEMLRSRTIEKMLMSRNVVRFVIDEAHCFSAWGQDFRIDYQYIGDFIAKLQKQKSVNNSIAVSCFTATAKQKVISDICAYFKKKLDLDLQLFATESVRDNLHYSVLYKETEEEKYFALRSLILQKHCPTIVYVSRTKKTEELSEKLCHDGILARPFHGQMTPNEKIDNQEAFIRNEVNVIVATSAFGMGVDKKDIGLVVHFDISDSLENYMQESGRAGRDAALQAECYVLYNDSDLDKHFILLNQTKLSISEIQQVWQAIKQMAGTRNRICCSPLEIARQAGWDQSGSEMEMRVKTAVGALENAGYIQRGNNMPHVYATGILAKNMEEAGERIEASVRFTEKQRTTAIRIIKSLISSRSIAHAGNEDAESRVDYLSDVLGIPKYEVIEAISLLREEGLLADSQDMSAFILKDDTQRKTSSILERFAKLEKFVLSQIQDDACVFNLKELNELAEKMEIPKPSVKDIRTVLFFLTIKSYIKKEESKINSYVRVMPQIRKEEMLLKYERRINICRYIVKEFYTRVENSRESPVTGEQHVQFSLLELFNGYQATDLLGKIAMQDIEDALLYLSKIGALRLEGGFLVLYNAMEIRRLEEDNRIRYKIEDYASLNDFYKQRIQQIHIVGEFANLMVRDYDSALQFVNDYFQMDYKKFINKYFKDDKFRNLNRNMTSKKYQKLFGTLSEKQRAIIEDDESKHIVVVAGPGSGKTRVLVHKLAAMLTLEDVKHEQLLMLTFSRAAATEFKMRLRDLIDNAANFVEIKTFHSYCFDLLGKIGNLQEADNVVRNAAEMIRTGEVEPERIFKRVLVIDEAQDMDEDEFELVKSLMAVNEDMRVIAVGDDDQNIYEFRGSDSVYLRSLITDYEATMYELVDNYRSKEKIVAFSNQFVKSLSSRLKNKDIVSISKEPGVVSLYQHQSYNMEEAVIENLVRNKIKGTSCIMTNTNDEAFQILGLLLKKGIRAKLIQSNDGFSLYNLAEVRFFLKKLSCNVQFDEEQFDDAKSELQKVYARSACLENCMNMLTTFETVCPSRYKSDLLEFIRESHYEDFYSDDEGAVYVSTIHKTKGREFDNVYMFLRNISADYDEQIRKLYVGMTRAKSSLYIHYNNNLFHNLDLTDIMKFNIGKSYTAPEEISIQLTHHDVVLNFFKDKKKLILGLQSGSPLIVNDGRVFTEVGGERKQVLVFSRSCLERLEHLAGKGYFLTHAVVRFVVAWRGEEDKDETAVLLPDIYLKKYNN